MMHLNKNHSLMINNIIQLFISNLLVSPYLISLYREGLITFRFPRVYDIVPFERLDGTSPQGFISPHRPYTLGRRPYSDQSYGQPHFLYFKWPTVTGNLISSTLNGQTDNIFHGKPIINPYWLSSEHNSGITRTLYFSDSYTFT